MFAAAQTKIRETVRERVGSLVDIAKAGFGDKNDGNTSRRFFDDFKTVSEIEH